MDSEVSLGYTIDDRLRELINKISGLERSLDRMKAWSGGVLIKTPEDLRNENEELKKHREEMKKKQQETNTKKNKNEEPSKK